MTMLGAEPQEMERGSIDPREYLRILSRQRWTVALTVLACLALAAAYLALAPKTYRAAATVLVKPVVTDWTGANSPNSNSIDIATEQSVAASDVVANDVRAKLRLTTTSAELLRRLKVTQGGGDATTLTFSYPDRSPTTARNVAATFAGTYLARRQAAAQASLTRAQKTLSGQITTLEARLAILEAKQTAGAPPTPSISIAANQISSLRTTLSRLSLATVESGSLISGPAAVDKLAASPRPPLVLAAGLMLGLLLGLILAFVRDRMSNRFVFSPAAGATMRPPVLETIPIKSLRTRGRAAGDPLADAGSPAAAAFGRASEHVRAQLTTSSALVLVTSAEDEPGTPVVAANLAAALAQTGTSVSLLTRLDPAKMAVAAGGGGPVATFADALAGRVSAADLGTTAGYAGSALHVVPLGDLAPGTLRTNAGLDLVRLLRQRQHILVVDAPSLLAGADALALAATADLILITAVDRVTRRSNLAAAAEHLAAVGARLVQTIVLTGRGGQPATPGPVVAPPARPMLQAAGSGSVRAEARIAHQAKEDWIS